MEIDQLCINTIRALAMDTVHKANSGHSGAPLGLAPAAHVLWSQYLQFDPTYLNRDRFVLSCGHASSLIYSLLHIHSGILTMEDLKSFRQFGSKTAGHPEKHLIPELEATTGCLGQGISNAVGLSVASHHLAARFNKPNLPIFSNKVFCFASDGDMMEGVQCEATSFAGHNKLGGLIVFWDNNSITISGRTDIAFNEDVPMRFRAYGWHVIDVADANTDYKAISAAIKEALEVSDKPVLINLKTIIGYGSELADTSKVHGTPLNKSQLENLKKGFGLDPAKSFFVDEKVYEFYEGVREKTRKAKAEWEKLYQSYKEQYPAEYEELQKLMSNQMTIENLKPILSTLENKNVATRVSSGTVINAIAKSFKGFIGGSADLTPSTCTEIKGEAIFSPAHYEGRNFEFGIREHGMMAIANGICYYGLPGLIPFVSTFFVFVQYLLPSLRLAALEHLRVILVMTHDSIGLGEDGATHQNVENFAVVRAIPNCLLMRPADVTECAAVYAAALTMQSRPAVMALSRQNAAPVEGSDFDKALKGGYIVKKVENPKAILVATGTEVSLAVNASKLLGMDVDVVSMPCMDIFNEQPEEYRKSVIAPGVPVISIEAGIKQGWEGISHVHLGVETFGMSAPAPKVYEHFGLVPEKVAEKVEKVVKFYENHQIPDLYSRPQF